MGKAMQLLAFGEPVLARESRRGDPVSVDQQYGHITCGELVFCDMGTVLNVWSYSGDDLDPEKAHALADALNAWADKKAISVQASDPAQRGGSTQAGERP